MCVNIVSDSLPRPRKFRDHWVSLDLRTGKRVWKTPDDLAAEPIWYCGLKNCLAVCTLESKRITTEKKEVRMKAKAARAVSSSSSAVPPAPPGAPRKQKTKTASKDKPLKSKSKPKTKKHTPTAGRGKTGNVKRKLSAASFVSPDGRKRSKRN